MKKKITSYIYQKYSLFFFFISNLLTLFKAILPLEQYSDFGEDKILSELAPSGEISYIDIGSGHPIIGSNTYYFYRLGHQGITIEPIAFHWKLHKFIRRRDLQINALVSNNSSRTDFYEFNPTQYSTASLEQYRRLTLLGMRPRKIYCVDSVRINRIFDLVKGKPLFISIDCEGYDLEILKQIDLLNYKNVFAIVIEIPMIEVDKDQVFEIMRLNKFTLFTTTKNNFIFQKVGE